MGTKGGTMEIKGKNNWNKDGEQRPEQTEQRKQRWNNRLNNRNNACSNEYNKERLSEE